MEQQNLQRGKRSLISLSSCWFWCGIGRIWKFPHAPEWVHVQDMAEDKVLELPRGCIEGKADKASLESVSPTTAEEPVSQGEPLCLIGLRDNSRGGSRS